ncbi:alpha-amylase/4-alpha-glucanotransferase domain-containing protein [uncultured Treponema sp.]|uniref:alpha-amylase/4-alpha-glucanotransferase domain-containing protein n=1 Tax=uncultured Treponema sp. TaxID=162155 RepID=UPI0025EF6B46|nr:alpha-amylase/4-alpha-glucanotransferase domain-containing protein [uncultured Treponema sp.]
MKVLNICFYITGRASILSHHEEFEEKYQNIYKNMVSFLFEEPDSHFSLSFSGPLVSWIDREHSEFTQLISKLIGKKQTEIIGSGYYNPVFPLLFPQDRSGQIDLMTAECRRCVGKRPRGMTVFNSVWDNNLVPCFQSCGMEYLFLDSSLIPKEKQCYLPLLLSEQGKSISVLPVSREFIPNMLIAPREYLRNLFDTINYLTKDDSYNILTDERVVAIKIDEHQFKKLYESKWLAKLYATAKEYFSDSVKITLPIEYLHREQTRVPSYIAAGIQSDVAKWARKPYEESVEHYSSRASIFDFLLTYRQNKALYDRMLYISLLINQCKGDKARKKIAREKLWIAQSGEGYICDPNGVFANNAVRQHAYRNLTEAEKLVRDAQKDAFNETVSSYDYNGDGFNEYICAMKQYNACISLHGAQISELDIIHNTGNYADSPSRIKQFDKVDDKYQRGLFVDHLFSLEEFAEYKKGVPTGSGIFSQTIFRQADFDAHRHEIKLSGTGEFSSINAKVTLVKKYIAKSGSLTVQYILKNDSPFDLKGVFVVESSYAQTDFSSVKANSYKVELVSNDEAGEIDAKESPRSVKKVSYLQITDTSNDILFGYEPNEICDIVCLPMIFRRPSVGSDVPTISGNSFVASLCWNIELMAGKEIEKNITYSITVPKKKRKSK